MLSKSQILRIGSIMKNYRHLCDSFKNKSDSCAPTNIIKYKNFESITNKTKNTYLEMIQIFIDRDNVHRRSNVEFIYSALKNMKHFGVNKDVEVYKALIDVLPKGKYIPENIIQAEFMHYPRQQQCIIDLLEQMEDNGVMPDYEIQETLLNIFGKRGFPLRKFWRMMYWMPKFKKLSPWPLPEKLSNDIFELAKLAVKRMSSVDIQSQLQIYQTADIPDALESTWIVSSQSETQKYLVAHHNSKLPMYVEGGFKIWIKDKPVNYFILRGDPLPLPQKDCDPDDVSKISVPLFSYSPPPRKAIIPYPSIHEQEDGIIFAVCVTGTSGRDSLLSWIRHLQKDGNPKLNDTPIVFSLLGPEKEVANTVGKNICDK